MSQDILPAQSTEAGEKEVHAVSFDEQMTWRARWFLICTIPFLLTASLLSGIIGYGLTKDPHCLVFASPTLMIYHTIRYLVPMDERWYQLQRKKVEMKARICQEKRRDKG